MLAGVPAVLFSTDGVKADGVMRELGLGDRVVPYPDFSLEEVHRQVVTIVREREAERSAVRETVRKARERTLAGLSEIARLLRPIAENSPELRV